MQYLHNAPPTMCWILFTTDIQLDIPEFSDGTLLYNAGSTYFNYLSRLFSMLRPGQRALARINTNTHIRRRNVETNKEEHQYDLADIRYTNTNKSIRHFASAEYHLDHSQIHMVSTYTDTERSIIFGPVYNIRYIYVHYYYSKYHVTLINTRRVNKITRINAYLWERTQIIKQFHRASEPTVLYSEGGKFDTFNPAIQLPTAIVPIIAGRITSNICHKISSARIIAGVWTLPLEYYQMSSVKWDTLDSTYIGPIYTDPVYNIISVPSRLYTQK